MVNQKRDGPVQVSARHTMRIISHSPSCLGKKLGTIKYLSDNCVVQSLVKGSELGTVRDELTMTTRARSNHFSPGVKRRSCALFMLSYDI